MRYLETYRDLGKTIENLYKARIEARAEDDLGECGAVFRHPDDNKLCWYYYRGGSEVVTNASGVAG